MSSIQTDTEKQIRREYLRNRLKHVFRQIANVDTSYDYDLHCASPEFCIQMLNFPNQRYFTRLLKKLRTRNKRWIVEFIELNGLFKLISCMDDLLKKGANIINSIVISQCVGCVKEIMNFSIGFQSIIKAGLENSSCSNVLAKSCSGTMEIVKDGIYELLSGMCLYSLDGHLLCEIVLKKCQEEKKLKSRFSTIIEELKTHTKSPNYLRTVLAFLNCFIVSTSDLRERLNIRVELLNLKFYNLLDDMKKIQNFDLFIQVNKFFEYQQEDEDESLKSNGIDLNNVKDLFDTLCIRLQKNSCASEKFLELLQLLFLMNDEADNKDVEDVNRVWLQLLDNSKMVINNSKARKLKHSSSQTDAPYQNVDVDQIQFAQAPPSVPQAQTSLLSNTISSIPPPPPPIPSSLFSKTNSTPTPPPPLPPLSNTTTPAAPPPPPPISTSLFSSSSKSKFPLPLPPLSNTTTPAAPPPPPPISTSLFSSSSKSKFPLPLPPLSNTTTPAAPPPPPPFQPQSKNQVNTGFINTIDSASLSSEPSNEYRKIDSYILGNASMTSYNASFDMSHTYQDCKTALYNLIPKSTKPLKSFNWQKLPDNAMSKNTIWKDLNSTNQKENLDYTLLDELFVKIPVKQIHSTIMSENPRRTNTRFYKSDSNNQTDESETERCRVTSTKSKSLTDKDGQKIQLLDAKRTMNVNIYLKQIKSPCESFIQLLINGQRKEIGFDNLNCLKKILPEKTEIDTLNEFFSTNAINEKQYAAELFIKQLTDVPMYELRIDAMLYLEEYKENYDRLIRPIYAINKCANVLLQCESLKSFLRLVLAAGNYINTNSNNGNAFGFKVSFLPKLCEIKTNKPSTSLLHVIVEQYEKEYKQLGFKFLEDLKDLGIVISQFKTNTKQIYDSLKSQKTPPDIRTQYSSLIETSYNELINTEIELNKIDQYEKDISIYYCEDRFDFDEFFKTFSDLCANINRIIQENKLRADAEEKVAKRKQELEKKRSKCPVTRHNTDSIVESSDEDSQPVFENLMMNIKMGNITSRRQSAPARVNKSSRILLRDYGNDREILI